MRQCFVDRESRLGETRDSMLSTVSRCPPAEVAVGEEEVVDRSGLVAEVADRSDLAAEVADRSGLVVEVVDRSDREAGVVDRSDLVEEVVVAE